MKSKQGKQGKQGLRGRLGKTGLPGRAGIRGLIGKTGERGATGARGRMGLRGPVGPRIEHAEVLAVVDSELGEIRKHFVTQIARTGQMQARLDEIHALLKVLIERDGGTDGRDTAADKGAPKEPKE